MTYDDPVKLAQMIAVRCAQVDGKDINAFINTQHGIDAIRLMIGTAAAESSLRDRV